MRLNLNYRGQIAKLRTKDGGFYFGKAQGVFRKIWTKTEIVLKCDGRRVDFGKMEGFICKK